MSDKIEKLAEALQGTPSSIAVKLSELFDDESGELTVEEAQELDQLVFECRGCGWWCEPCEANPAPDGDGDECDDCYDDS